MADTDTGQDTGNNGTGVQDNGDGTASPDGRKKPTHVTMDRFNEVLSARNAAREELATLRADVTELKAGHSSALEELQGKVEEAAKEAAKLAGEKSWAESMIDLARDGVEDEEIVDYLRYKYDRLEVEEGKDKPTFSEWYGEYKATEPTVLRPFLSGDGVTKTKPRAPKTTDGSREPKNVATTDPTRIASMSREEYQANREALLKAAAGE